MSEDQIKRTIEPTDVEWEMDWDPVLFPDKPAREMQLEEENALALLLLNDVCCLNSFWYEDAWPAEARTCINVFVNCSDLFAYSCADAERLPHAEIGALYRSWARDPTWGAVAWAVQRRRERPIPPVERALREAGYDVDAWELGANVTNAQTQAAFARARAADKSRGDADR